MSELLKSLIGAGSTSAPLHAWLSGKADNEGVGYPCRAGDCPLARYLKEQGLEDITIMSVGAHAPGAVMVPLAGWALFFRQRIDATYPMGIEVLAYQARSVLA